MKIFIVEDSALVRERIAAALREGVQGIEIVGEANSAAEAIDAIHETKPDVVVLDIRLKGSNGIDVLREIKKPDASPTVIVLTSYPYRKYREKCAEAGADFFLDKLNEFGRLPEMCRMLASDKSKKAPATGKCSKGCTR